MTHAKIIRSNSHTVYHVEQNKYSINAKKNSYNIQSLWNCGEMW